ncbi:Drug Metabolite transporter superfamily [Micractinium conductrix]|uniref:Drug Metabolite transporter superfamily n=1 Tax=Micractinium conductrix TaxID=554055 RepID=A0A2P6VNK3_9CHLO|nr:Drug Metabolite transporter superfamily [Micractinium conductrix]|eukprot:PSC75670.1 Drug Metabolite transporter superfamily [Micractinium conductrix]
MLRLLYSQDGPPGPVAIMLFRGVLQAAVLVTAYSIFGSKGQQAADGSSSSSSEATATSSSNGSAAGSSSEGSSGEAGASGSSEAPSFAEALLRRIPFTAIASTELGLWLFLATGIQTLGLQLTTATRAGFLIQATALLTPLLASFTGEKPSRNVWIGCIIALAGCLAIAADQSATDGDDAALFSLGGDAAILSSAFFFSLATVRLGTYARLIPAVNLAAGKSLVLGGAALATFCAAAASMTAAGDPLTDLWPGYASSGLGWAVMCYAALGPGAAAAFLHAKGQSVVPPAEAQVIFSSVPLWSIAFAFLLLGGEPLTTTTLVGGAAVVAAGIVASRKVDDGGSGGGGDKGGKQASPDL